MFNRWHCFFLLIARPLGNWNDLDIVNTTNKIETLSFWFWKMYIKRLWKSFLLVAVAYKSVYAIFERLC